MPDFPGRIDLGGIKMINAKTGTIPKGYPYFATAFSLVAGMLNLSPRKKPMHLMRTLSGEAEAAGMFKMKRNNIRL